MTKIKDTDGKEYAEIDVKNTGETEMAVQFNDGDRQFWVPKSCLEDWPDINKTGTALVAIWFAGEKGII